MATPEGVDRTFCRAHGMESGEPTCDRCGAFLCYGCLYDAAFLPKCGRCLALSGGMPEIERIESLWEHAISTLTYIFPLLILAALAFMLLASPALGPLVGLAAFLFALTVGALFAMLFVTIFLSPVYIFAMITNVWKRRKINERVVSALKIVRLHFQDLDSRRSQHTHRNCLRCDSKLGLVERDICAACIRGVAFHASRISAHASLLIDKPRISPILASAGRTRFLRLIAGAFGLNFLVGGFSSQFQAVAGLGLTLCSMALGLIIVVMNFWSLVYAIVKLLELSTTIPAVQSMFAALLERIPE
jgi:hypothetical protein